MFMLRRSALNEHWLATCETTGAEFDDRPPDVWSGEEPHILCMMREHAEDLEDGLYTVASLTRAKPAPAFVPSMILDRVDTEHGNKRWKATCDRCGADQFDLGISEPISLERAVARIRDALGKADEPADAGTGYTFLRGLVEHMRSCRAVPDRHACEEWFLTCDIAAAGRAARRKQKR